MEPLSWPRPTWAVQTTLQIGVNKPSRSKFGSVWDGNVSNTRSRFEPLRARPLSWTPWPRPPVVCARSKAPFLERVWRLRGKLSNKPCLSTQNVAANATTDETIQARTFLSQRVSLSPSRSRPRRDGRGRNRLRRVGQWPILPPAAHSHGGVPSAHLLSLGTESKCPQTHRFGLERQAAQRPGLFVVVVCVLRLWSLEIPTRRWDMAFGTAMQLCKFNHWTVTGTTTTMGKVCCRPLGGSSGHDDL
jgi:hypothetical protein